MKYFVYIIGFAITFPFVLWKTAEWKWWEKLLTSVLMILFMPLWIITCIYLAYRKEPQKESK